MVEYSLRERIFSSNGSNFKCFSSPSKSHLFPQSNMNLYPFTHHFNLSSWINGITHVFERHTYQKCDIRSHKDIPYSYCNSYCISLFHIPTKVVQFISSLGFLLGNNSSFNSLRSHQLIQNSRMYSRHHFTLGIFLLYSLPQLH